MTAQEIDAEGYHPIAGGTKPIMHFILRKRRANGEHDPYTYMTWSHDNKEFTIPMILNDYEIGLVKKSLDKNIN
jgi:hypothetical protein